MRTPAVAVALAVVLLSGCSSGNSTHSASTTSTAAQTATTQGASTGTSTGLPIPNGSAIDAISNDLTNPKAAALIARCKAYADAFRANAVTGGHEAAVMKLLNNLADAVRPVDPAVADALAAHAGAAAAWCRVKFATNS